MDWIKAREILNYNYREFLKICANYELFRLDTLFDRYDNGERTKYLYNDILNLEFQPEECGY